MLICAVNVGAAVKFHPLVVSTSSAQSAKKRPRPAAAARLAQTKAFSHHQPQVVRTALQIRRASCRPHVPRCRQPTLASEHPAALRVHRYQRAR